VRRVHTIEVRRQVRAAPEVVWALATDIPGSAAVLSGVDRVEMLSSPAAFGPGTRWRETRRFGGRAVTEELVVTAVETGRSYTVEADSRGAHYVSRFTFTPAPDGETDVALSFGAEADGTVKRLLQAAASKVMARAVAKQLLRDLDDLARAAERRSGLA
jgi:uncharacterized protein YndB with AHSA1/START domain